MVDKMCAAWNLPLTEVGHWLPIHCAGIDEARRVVRRGGERSVGFAGHIPERDGMAAGLFLLEMLATEKVSVNKILCAAGKGIRPAPLRPIDTHYPLEKRAALMDIAENQSAGRNCCARRWPEWRRATA